ncbi:hypothetical protein Zm00014a_029325 [Zea mays]|uniref:Uncharacterized protein n=1 Tax=Zea mays TaxID=4577 RepID=A0A3L6EB60_MAIZE|nr:hypothetical protein Zm00014a_029325 [Zea mays]
MLCCFPSPSLLPRCHAVVPRAPPTRHGHCTPWPASGHARPDRWAPSPYCSSMEEPSGAATLLHWPHHRRLAMAADTDVVHLLASN